LYYLTAFKAKSAHAKRGFSWSKAT